MTTLETLQQTVDALLKKAVEAHTSGEALHYTQAALNAAHTYHALVRPSEP